MLNVVLKQNIKINKCKGAFRYRPYRPEDVIGRAANFNNFFFKIINSIFDQIKSNFTNFLRKKIFLYKLYIL